MPSLPNGPPSSDAITTNATMTAVAFAPVAPPQANVGVIDMISSAGVKTRRAPIVFFLLAAIACSVAPMFGDSEGWLYWEKDNYMIDSSPYIGLLKYVFIASPEAGVDPNLLDALNGLLPNIPADVSVTLGWRNYVSKVVLHTEEAEPLSDFVKTMALSMVPPDFTDNVNRILDEGRDSLKEDYVGRRTAAKYSGAFSVAFLGLSAIYAVLCLVMVAVNQKSVMGRRTMADWLLSKSWLIGGLLYIMMGTEYVVLAVGAHRELTVHPVVQKGFIAWPDWAWIIAMFAATSWAAIAILMFILHRDVKRALRESLQSKTSTLVATKESWNIPAIV